MSAAKGGHPSTWSRPRLCARVPPRSKLGCNGSGVHGCATAGSARWCGEPEPGSSENAQRDISQLMKRFATGAKSDLPRAVHTTPSGGRATSAPLKLTGRLCVLVAGLISRVDALKKRLQKLAEKVAEEGAEEAFKVCLEEAERVYERMKHVFGFTEDHEATSVESQTVKTTSGTPGPEATFGTPKDSDAEPVHIVRLPAPANRKAQSPEERKVRIPSLCAVVPILPLAARSACVQPATGPSRLVEISALLACSPSGMMILRGAGRALTAN
ncbi:hypothetical protein PR202_ga08646 [Eleusine coracana subsp. coracana]|uniref:Uncharacterized protein n=1 Tax=Eleusine coracana subsp. coracana TaxID=191504 RepID=A0AAV5C0T0_ELECO|nr:hypothetical protein PR202_ga08646 [Eleusine coracana subsp. coracana]